LAGRVAILAAGVVAETGRCSAVREPFWMIAGREPPSFGGRLTGIGQYELIGPPQAGTRRESEALNPSGGHVLVTFIGGASGPWQVRAMAPIAGVPLARIERLHVREGNGPAPSGLWQLRGAVSHTRYTTRREVSALAAVHAPLDRPESTFGALIPIRKSARWWSLAQDERREIYEERSRHTSIGLQYLPRIARRLHHSRDLGEPFDFLTWFEFAPEHEPAFDELLAKLRGSEEWKYVEREVDIRVQRV
jgi:hypothetical protein